MSDILSEKQLLVKIGISHSTILRWNKNGLPSHKVGGRRLFIYSEVVEWIRNHDKVGKRST